MALRFMVEGCIEKVNEFVELVKSIPGWRFYQFSKMSIGGNELRMDCYLDKKEHQKIKPSLTDKPISKLSITSQTGETMEITLLDAEVVHMGSGITYIHGKSYDPFSASVGEGGVCNE
ncbi:hypothetical protein MK805_07405 [Shimazuella sp. AN120528]|uniref:hypothetical protein n=1 Tax=Shimazuella soli TaxID=1892854 RepID=UPI001F0DBF35|nr:hypothetical protein [Shimazuella soli]MCH5584798.1 hypothetical protein [Shimazuella soli]